MGRSIYFVLIGQRRHKSSAGWWHEACVDLLDVHAPLQVSPAQTEKSTKNYHVCTIKTCKCYFRQCSCLWGTEKAHTVCWKHFLEMWVYTDTITSDSCSRFVGWTSMMSISRSTTSQRCFTALEWSPQSPDLNPVNLSCSRNQFWVLLHGTLSCCKHPYADGSIHADRPSPTPPSHQSAPPLYEAGWIHALVMFLPHSDPTSWMSRQKSWQNTRPADKTQALHIAQHTQCSLCSEECLDRYTDLLHICIAQHRRTTSVGRDSAGYLHL